MEKIFLCHVSKDAFEIRVLAEELRMRGVAPWVDKEVGDESAGEAGRAIDEECFGLLVYATPEAFASDFIRQVEVRRALGRKEWDTSFVVSAVPRRMGFRELLKRSTEEFGVDLAAFSSRALEGAGGESAEELRLKLAAVAHEVLDKALALAGETDLGGTLRMQFSTRERLSGGRGRPPDRRRRVAGGYGEPVSGLGAVHGGVSSVKRRVSRHLGRPRLRVHGSKHLTAAFLPSFVFPSTVCEVEIRTRVGYWSTDCEPTTSEDLLLSKVSDGAVGTEALYVEISTGNKIMLDGVRRHVSRTRVNSLKYLRFTPGPELSAASHMTNADARSMADQVRRGLSGAVSDYGISKILLSAAIPRALAVMLGHGFNAMPPVQLYEYERIEYRPSHRLVWRTWSPPRTSMARENASGPTGSGRLSDLPPFLPAPKQQPK